MSEELQEVKYYELMSYKDSKAAIKSNIDQTARNFVAIGYYLKHIRDKEMFTEDGYQSIWELAQAEFGISKSQASKFMAINDKFSKDGNSPILLDKYKEFSSSKLSEMLYLTDEQLEQLTPATTVVKIREIKNTDKTVSTSKQEAKLRSHLGFTKSVYPPDSLIASKGCGNKYDCFSCSRICQIRQEDRYCVEAPMGHPFSCTTMNVLDSIENDIGGECMFINQDLAYHRAGDHEPVPCCKDCKNKCGYACSKAAHGPKPDDITETVNNEPEIVDIEPDIVDEPGLPCDTCGWDIQGCCDYDNKDMHCVMGDAWKPKSDPAETVEVDIIQTIPENKTPLKKVPDKWYYLVPIGANDITGKAIREGDILEWTDLRGNTKQYQVYYEPRSFSFLPCKIERIGTDTLKMIPSHELCKSRIIRNVHEGEEFISEEVKEESEEPKPVQPELPILKNNDQRKEFIDAYGTWPIWIETKETEERYYRYDLSDGASIVVKVYYTRLFDYKATGLKYEDRLKDDWGEEEYYLLKPDKHFKDCETNRSILVEYLKDLQKKGA